MTTLYDTITQLASALADIITKAPQVVTALTALRTFLTTEI